MPAASSCRRSATRRGSSFPIPPGRARSSGSRTPGTICAIGSAISAAENVVRHTIRGPPGARGRLEIIGLVLSAATPITPFGMSVEVAASIASLLDRNPMTAGTPTSSTR